MERLFQKICASLARNENLVLSTIGNIVWDELATSNDLYSTSEVTVSCTVSATGNDSTAGYGVVYVQYIQDNGLGRSS